MINLTLVVQMLHFALAYFLVDRIVLRTAYARIRQEDDARSLVQATLRLIEQQRISG